MARNKKTSGAAQSNRRQRASGEDRNARMPLLGFVPVPIEAGWVPGYDHLEGFPVTVLFAAVSRVGDALTPRCCTYIPEPGTYIESSGRRAMWYVPQHESPYSVSVTEDSQTGDWTIAKYRGGEFVGMSVGPTLRCSTSDSM